MCNHQKIKEIPGYYGSYFISSHGRVWSIPKIPQNPDGRWLKLSVDHNGYPKIGLKKEGKSKNFSVHRLVAEAFIPNPLNLAQVNHRDGHKNNNCVRNLEWCTPSQNKLHSFALGLEKNHKKGEHHKNSKLSFEQAKRIKYSSGPHTFFAKRYRVSPSLVQRIRSGIAWKHI